MATRNVHFYLIKAARISGWFLLLLVIMYLCTGFTMCGQLGFNKVFNSKVFNSDRANEIHKLLVWPVVPTFLVHASITTYFALRRWGWIKKRTCK